jgi:hypothetical protein
MNDDKEVFLVYTVVNALFQNALIKYVKGDKPGTTGALASIEDPEDTLLPFAANAPDPKVFSYAIGQNLALLLARVTTVAGNVPSNSCVYTLAIPVGAQKGIPWKTLARNITLTYRGLQVATNPYGVAQIGTMLYIIDYDSTKVYRLGVNELNGLAEGSEHELAFEPIDLGPNLPAIQADGKYRGQAIVAMRNGATSGAADCLFALFNYSTDSADEFQPSALLRVNVDISQERAVFDSVLTTGKNSREIIPLAGSNGTVYLLIPAIGGMQQGGTTNGINSTISCVTAFGDWSSYDGAARDLLTGNTSTSSGTGDIHALAGPARADDAGAVYILVVQYEDTFLNAEYWIYRTTIAQLLGLQSGKETLADAVSGGTLVVAESDTGAGYYWDLLYENADSASGDRLLALLGSPILITLASNFDRANGKEIDPGTGAGSLGDLNINSADLVSETMRQAAMGVSLKRGLRGSSPVSGKAAEEEEE